MENLDSSKTAQESDIPTKINKDNIDIFAPILYQEFNKSIETGKFPSEMKSADITQVLINYRPISVLPNLSKVFERCIYSKFSLYFDTAYPNTRSKLAHGEIFSRKHHKDLFIMLFNIYICCIFSFCQ